MSKKEGNSILLPPALIVIAILCLWANEGRFDYYHAARQTTEIPSPEKATAEKTISLTGDLQPCWIAGQYVTGFSNFYQVLRTAEIYCWKREEDSDGKVSWEKGWHRSCESNSRNANMRQVLHSTRLGPTNYQVGDLKIQPQRLHFSDKFQTIDPRNLQLSDLARSLDLKIEGDFLYLRKRNSQGEIGDERLTFEGIPTKPTATYFGLIDGGMAVGKQHEYKRNFISNLIKNDGMLHHLVNGTRPEALKTVKEHIRKLKWTVRLVGTAVVTMGLMFFLGRFLHFLIAIPLIGHFVGSGVFLVSLVLGITISTVTIISSMVYHNPVTVFLGIGLMTLLVAALLILRNKARSNARRRLQSTFDAGTSNPLINTDDDSRWDAEERRQQTYCNLVKLAMIDGELEESENDFLVKWGRTNGLSDESIAELFDKAKRETEDGLEATQFEDLPTLVSLAMIDGYLSAKELNHIIHFGQKLGMNRAQVNAVVAGVRNGEYQEQVAA